MTSAKRFLRVAVLAALAGTFILFAPVQLRAQVTYTYMGNPYMQFNQSYACPPVCRYTGSFTMAQPLAPNLPYRTQIFPLSFSFTDGLNVFSNSSSLISPVFLVGTDTSGNIVAWFIELDVLTSPTSHTFTHISYTCSAPDCPPAAPTDWTTDLAPGGITVTNFASNRNSPGTWTQGPVAQSRVYVTNFKSNTVSVFDSSTNTLVSTIPVGINPVGVVLSPNGGLAYVANQTFPGSVSVINTQSNTVVATISVGPFPTGIAITPNGRFVYVVDGTSPGAVSVIDATTNSVVAIIPEGAFPDWVAISPDGAFAYVTNTFSTPAYISVISTATNTQVATIGAGQQPAGMAITPNGSFAYVTDVLANNVDVIDLRTSSVVTTIPAGINPGRVSITKDGASAYVSNFNSGSVSVIDTKTNKVVTTIPVGIEPLDVAFTPDGLLAYVANSDFFGGLGNVSVIDTISRTVVATLGAGNVPDGAAATPPPPPASTGCVFSLSPPAQTLGPQVGFGSFTVNAAAACQWQLSLSTNWIGIFSPGPSPGGGPLRGTGSRKVFYVVASNSGTARSGTISVNNLAFTVNQAGVSPAPSCAFTISPSYGVVDDLGGRIRVVVNSPSGCAWTAASNAVWLAVASGASGQGVGAVILQVAPNTNGPRTGTATIAGQTLTVSQGAGACGALDVTSHVAVSGSGRTPIPWTNYYSQTITVTNTSGSVISGPIYLVTIGEPTHFGFPNDSGLLGGGAVTHCFSPSGDYLLLLSGNLQPGQTVGVPLVWFTQSFTARINFSTRVLSGTPTH